MGNSTDLFMKVAVGIVVNPQQEVLTALRPLYNPHGGLWEFPGGKFEAGETAQEALKRELIEEVGITVREAYPFMCVQKRYAHICVELDAWFVTAWEGVARGCENQEIRWVDRQGLLALTFPDGNQKIVEKLARLLA